jgi:hypothetical protein
VFEFEVSNFGLGVFNFFIGSNGRLDDRFGPKLGVDITSSIGRFGRLFGISSLIKDGYNVGDKSVSMSIK